MLFLILRHIDMEAKVYLKGAVDFNSRYLEGLGTLAKLKMNGSAWWRSLIKNVKVSSYYSHPKMLI